MDFLQGRSVETMVAVAVAVVAVAVGGALLLRRSKRPKGMYGCAYFRLIHSVLTSDACDSCVIWCPGWPEFGGFQLVLAERPWNRESSNSATVL